VGTAFAVFCSSSIIFPNQFDYYCLLLINFFSEIESETVKSELLFEDSGHSICCFFFLNSTSQENCGAGINNGAIKCKLFVDKYLKTCRWVSYTFLQKPSLFNLF